jgi:calcineurin-like phosphoesterase
VSKDPASLNAVVIEVGVESHQAVSIERVYNDAAPANHDSCDR